MSWSIDSSGDLYHNRSERNIRIFPVYSYNLRGKQEDILGYEICEMWKAYVQHPTPFGTYSLQWHEATVLEFKEREDAVYFMELLYLVLKYAGAYRYPQCLPKTEILKDALKANSQTITDILSHAPLAEIAKRKECEKQLQQRILEAETTGDVNVYAFYYDNNCTKIGISEKVYTRMPQVTPPPLRILKAAYIMPGFPRAVARQIEAECHRFFAPKRRSNEYFDITFEEACEKLQTYGELVIAAGISKPEQDK